MFSLKTNGSNFAVLYTFSGTADGLYPEGLSLAGNTLFGVAVDGRSETTKWGTIYALNTDGSDFAVLHAFSQTNFDGAYPEGAPLLIGATLFGTAEQGGAGNNGTVYALTLQPRHHKSNCDRERSRHQWDKPHFRSQLRGADQHASAVGLGRARDQYPYRQQIQHWRNERLCS